MNSTNPTFSSARSAVAFPFVALIAALLTFATATPAYAQRVFGVDTASVANSTAPSQAAWNNAFNDADGDGVAYKFAIVRALFGNNSTPDSQFYTNISRATTAGMLSGSYHFVTPVPARCNSPAPIPTRAARPSPAESCCSAAPRQSLEPATSAS